MTILTVLLILSGLALLVSATGFIRVVWFVSIGYAYSIAAMAILIAILFGSTMGVVTWIQLGLLVLYGIRLGTYILLREGKSAYKRELGDVHARESAVSLVKRFPIWIGVSVLYVAMILPALSPALIASGVEGVSPGWLSSGSLAHTVISCMGLAIQALGFFLETLADSWKNHFKRSNPDRFCSTGPYRFVRCPNYLGEIMVWVGSFLAGFTAFGTWWQWVAGVAGLLCIVLIMMGSTKRLEAKQEERYGHLADYQAFATSVPVLFPFIPVYTLKNIRVYLE